MASNKHWGKMRSVSCLLLLLAVLCTSCTGQYASKSGKPAASGSDKFILVTINTGDTYAELAATHLKDKDKAWQIAALNQYAPLSPGQRIAVPLVPVIPGGLFKNGYQTVPVLAYSGMAKTPSGSKTVSVTEFGRQLDYLKDNGYVTVSIDRFLDFLDLRDQLPSKAVVITLDDAAGWAYSIAYPALKQRAMRAAFFIAPDDIGRPGKVTWPQLAEMTAAGMLVGIYGPGIQKPAREDAKAYLEAFEGQIVAPRRTFRRHLKQPCRYYAYPQGVSDDMAIAILKKHGFKAAFTRKPGSNPFFTDKFQINRFEIDGHDGMNRFRQGLATFHPLELK
jgi:peptidoglycan/xylan/chitin deacetylase (PgdA/CDA1 family)